MAVALLLVLLPGLSIAALSENLATGGRAVQSSMYKYNMGRAQTAVDGDSDPDFMQGSCSHTGTQKDPWWRLDLPSAYRIGAVSITNRGDCCSERIRGAQIRVGNSLVNNGNDNHLAAVVESIPAGDTHTFTFTPIEGQYVSILLPGNRRILSLCEVQVFADDGSQTTQTTAQPTDGYADEELVSPHTDHNEDAVTQDTDVNAGQEQTAEDADGGDGDENGDGGDGDENGDGGEGAEGDDEDGEGGDEDVDGGEGGDEDVDGGDEDVDGGDEDVDGGEGGDEDVDGGDEDVDGGDEDVYGGEGGDEDVDGGEGGDEDGDDGVEEVTAAYLQRITCDTKLVNVAAGVGAVQSSTFTGQLGYARHAVDGNTEARFQQGSCTHTETQRDPWWRADLTAAYNISRVSLTNRADCCKERITGAQIRIGNSLENHGNNNRLVAIAGIIPSGATETFVFPSTEGRYVNIFLPGVKKILTLCEVQVFAEEKNCTSAPFTSV